MKIKICIPSYKRPLVKSLEYLPSAEVYVAKSEYENYKNENFSGAKIIAVEDKWQGNLCRIRNRILDLNKGDAVCIVDDDMSRIAYWENKKEVALEKESEVMEFLYKYTIMALDFGVKLWGININKDKQVYREYTPFSLTSYIGGPFMVHLDSDIRFDERFSLKEDYDITLQHLNKYRKVLRVNKYFYDVKQHKQVGGCATYRNFIEEERQLRLLQKKWGNHIVKFDNNDRSHNMKKVKKRIDFNPIIKVPIKGI